MLSICEIFNSFKVQKKTVHVFLPKIADLNKHFHQRHIYLYNPKIIITDRKSLLRSSKLYSFFNSKEYESYSDQIAQINLYVVYYF